MVLGKWNSSKLGHVTHQVGLVLPDLVADGELWELHPPEVAKVLDCKVVFVRHVFHVMESLLLLTKIGPQTYRWNGYEMDRMSSWIVTNVSLNIQSKRVFQIRLVSAHFVSFGLGDEISGLPATFNDDSRSRAGASG